MAADVDLGIPQRESGILVMGESAFETMLVIGAD